MQIQRSVSLNLGCSVLAFFFKEINNLGCFELCYACSNKCFYLFQVRAKIGNFIMGAFAVFQGMSILD